MDTLTTTSARASVRGKLMATLFVAQVCGSTGQSIGLAVGSIVAASITGTNTWSGLPIAVGAPAGPGAGLWPRRHRRAPRHDGRNGPQLLAPARRDGALRHREHLQPPRTLRRRGRPFGRAAR